jgi:exopolysaccharide production protein ExoQ
MDALPASNHGMGTGLLEPSMRARRLARARNTFGPEERLSPTLSVPTIARPSIDTTICTLFTLGIIVLLFHVWKANNVGPTAQLLGVAFIVAAGSLAWLFGVRPAAPAPVELCLLAIGFLSLLRLTQNDYISSEAGQTSLSVSLILLVAVFGNAALVRRISMERLLNVSATALALVALLIVVFQIDGIVAAMTAGEERYANLFRAFDMHHTMTSILCSLGIMLSVYQIISAKPWVKAVFALTLVAQIAIVLASGGRTGIVACTLSLLLVFVTRMRSAPPVVWVGLAAATIASLVFLDAFVATFSQLMELDSQNRGWGSGASGRTEIWAKGFDLIMADPVRLLFGSGLRTTAGESADFNPENSYIAITLESGAILMIVFVTSLIATIFRLHYHAGDPDKDKRLILYGLLPILQFALIVGIFNRQLLSVGNPSSMIFLVVFAGSWIYVNGPRAVIRHVANTGGVPISGAERRRLKAREISFVQEHEELPSARRQFRRRRVDEGRSPQSP